MPTVFALLNRNQQYRVNRRVDEEISEGSIVTVVSECGVDRADVTLSNGLLRCIPRDALSPVQDLQVGDVVEITGAESSRARRQWTGFRARVRSLSTTQVYLDPLSPRPDGANHLPFYWDRPHLRLIPFEIEIGDRVRIADPAYCGEGGMVWSEFYGQEGTVIGLNNGGVDQPTAEVRIEGTDYPNHINVSDLTRLEGGSVTASNNTEEVVTCVACDEDVSDGYRTIGFGFDTYCESCYGEVVASCELCGVDRLVEELIETQDSLRNLCINCAHRCSECGRTVEEATYIENNDRYACDGCWEYCPTCDEVPVLPGDYCYDCDNNMPVNGIAPYGRTSAIHWLGGPLPIVNGARDGFYVGAEWEVYANRGDVSTLYDWAGENLGYRDALICKEDSSVTGFEIAFQPMTPEFFESVDWESFADRLNDEFPLRDDLTTEPVDHGIHVHIGRIAFKRNGEQDDLSIAAFAYLLSQGNHLERIGRRQATGYCPKLEKPVSAAVMTGQKRDRQWNRIAPGMGYVGRNAVNLSGSSTIEIRSFRSTRKASEFRDAVRVVYTAAEYIRHLRRQRKTNPKALHWTSFSRWVCSEYPEAYASIAGPRKK